jgi:phage shock protein PspC (stress-responsive transcriptional regulator)
MRRAAGATMVVVMTETLSDVPPPPPPPPPPPARRLVRDPDDRVVAGVCAAAGRYTGTDPVLWRVLVAVTVLFGGLGIALYVLGWLLVPRADQPQSFVERHLRRADRSVDIAGAVLVGLIALLLLAVLDGAGGGLVVLAVAAGIAYLVARERSGHPAGPPAPGPPQAGWTPGPAPTGWGPDAPTTVFGPVPPAASYGPPGPPSYAAPADGPQPEPAAPRPRSVLGPVTVSVAALTAGVLLTARELGADGITGARVIAAALLVVGVGLVVGTWLGRARWLIAVGLALGLLLLPTAALDDAELAEGAGSRLWLPSTADEQRFGLRAGEAVLDLREVEPGEVESVRANVGVGSLVALVPDDLRVRVTTDTLLGDVVHADASTGLTDDDDGRGDTRVLGPATGSLLEVDLYVGVGEIEVRRVAG